MLNRSRAYITIIVVLPLLLMSAAVLQAEEKDFYVGVAGNYQLLNYDDPYHIDWDDNANGINAKFGYRLAHTLYLQIDADYTPKVEGSLEGNELELELLSGMASLKGYFPVRTPLKPFVILGAGVMHYNVDDEAVEDDEETDFCAKIGVGLDLFIGDHFSVGVEGNYTSGLDEIEEIEYFGVSAGAAIHF